MNSPQPQTIRALTIVHEWRGTRCDAFLRIGDTGQALEASDDGQNLSRGRDAFPTAARTEHTISFAPVTAKFFRVTFKRHRLRLYHPG